MNIKKTILMLLLSLAILNTGNAAVEIKEFANSKQEQRYKTLVNELRCLVCQNQNLADSNAVLAQDLRKKVYEMIVAGETDKAIKTFMVSRYGDFVLYRPPFKISTLVLWLGPVIILIMSLFFLIRFIQQRNSINPEELSVDEKKRIKELLSDNREDEQ